MYEDILIQLSLKGQHTLRAFKAKDRKAIEIGDAVISNAKIKETLSWKPKVGFEEGLKLTYNYFQNKLDHYLK